MASKKKLARSSAKGLLTLALLATGPPIISELTGYSQGIANQLNETQREELVQLVDNPSYRMHRADIQKSIDHMAQYTNLRDTSARFGVDSLALLFGVLGASYIGRRFNKRESSIGDTQTIK